MSSPLEIQNLTKRVGEFTLVADFSLARGERAGLVGRSGSGKTTLLRTLAGLETPDSGRILLDGQEITQLPPQKRKIGYVFQDQALFPALDVLGNLAFGLRMRGVPRAEREAEAASWLKKADLEHLKHASVAQLSGGEAQRVAFVRALIWKPSLLLLDEPFSALDAGLRATLRRELLVLHALWPVPLLLVSHDEQDLEQLVQVRLEFEETPDRRVRKVRRV